MDIKDRVKIKTIRFRGGYTISRYTVTCDCGCEDVPYINYWPSKTQLSETTIKNKIVASLKETQTNK